MNLNLLYSTNKQNHPLESIALNELREKAYLALDQNGLPSKKEEAWKFTSINDFKNIDWALPDAELFLSHDQMVAVSKSLPSDFYNIVFVNGMLNNTLSDSDIEIEKIDLQPKDFHITAHDVDYTLVHLSRSLNSVKYVLNFKKNQVVDKPVQIVHIVTGDKTYLVQPILDINAEENSDVKIIFHRLSVSSPQQIAQALNMDVNVRLHTDAKMKFAHIDNSDIHDFNFSRIKYHLEQRSKLVALDVALGSQVSRHYTELAFQAESAEAGLYGLNLLANDQHCDHYTFIHHIKGSNQSIQHYKSILAEKSRSVFRGRVRIEQDAQKANSEQLNNNLLISPAASADSVPQLEIYADDVKAGHGSTVGQLNKDEIFYFLSRGISQRQAVQMLSHGYAKELVYKLENEQIENFIFEIINTKLDEMF